MNPSFAIRDKASSSSSDLEDFEAGIATLHRIRTTPAMPQEQRFAAPPKPEPLAPSTSWWIGTTREEFRLAVQARTWKRDHWPRRAGAG